MPDRTEAERRLVGAWLDDLARLVVGGRSLPETRRLLGCYLEPLATEPLPVEAFNPASLAAVARAARSNIPTYGDVVEQVGGWWAVNKPASTPPRVEPLPGYEDLTPREQADVRAWLRRVDDGSSTPAKQLSLMRQMAREGGSQVTSWEREARALIRGDARYAAANADDRYFVTRPG